ncbi:hypothetical protein GOP47_0027471 [Adiantum capillus-veneris]|nr:hypothetical protein GOP47_0027471 [Adiantum capillus-veneris]
MDMAKDFLSSSAASYAKMKQVDDLSGLLNALESLLLESAGFPTLIVDEVNSLHEWSLDPQKQRNLLQMEKFFIRITKQERLANVVLSTSDDFFRGWMNIHIGADRYSIGVIGDLLADESLNYFLHELEQLCQRLGHKRMQPPSNDLWQEIFQFTGGRALILSNLALKLYISHESISAIWPSLKKTLLSRALSEVQEGLYPEGFSPKWTMDLQFISRQSPLWSADMWRTTMGLISQAKDGVLSKVDLLSSGVSLHALYSMVQHNLLHYRAEASLWAKDLDWYQGPWPIVMPRSRPHYHAICQLVAQGEKN